MTEPGRVLSNRVTITIPNRQTVRASGQQLGPEMCCTKAAVSRPDIATRKPHRECSIQTNHYVIMKAGALRFNASCFAYTPRQFPGWMCPQMCGSKIPDVPLFPISCMQKGLDTRNQNLALGMSKIVDGKTLGRQLS